MMLLSAEHLSQYQFFLGGKGLPEGWAVASLQQISHIVTDGTHKTPKYQSEGVRFISIKNIRPYVPVNWDAYEKYISQEEHVQLIKRCYPQKDDILFPRIGTLGFAKRIDFEEEVSIFVGLGLIKPIKQYIDPRFLEYYMNTPYIAKISQEKANGTGRMTLPLEESRNFPVPVPPLDEQKRIVAKIEELFSELDKGIESLKTAREQLKVYRQAVLKHAFEGKLTRKSDTTTGWSVTKFKSLYVGTQNGLSKRKGETGKPVPVLRLADIDQQQVSSADLRSIILDQTELEKYGLLRGDLLCIRVNGSPNLVGRMVLIKSDDKMAYCDHFIRFRFDATKVNPAYVRYFLNTQEARRYVDLNKVSSAGQNTVSQATLGELDVPFCSIDEQNLIVEMLDEKFSSIDAIELEIAADLQRVEALRQAILKKAFSGQLVTQNPKDEPASVLLERIHTEKEAPKSKAKKKRSAA